ncbi:MAG: hypothetical protein QOH97_4466 [Actinoplanes sp.]|jgi:hypothetical protein|nr:hypothetical protein [Actinoplanes sp.]
MPEPMPAFNGRIPPINPPPGCVSPLMWHLSRRLFADHRRGPDGWCLNCRPAHSYPCVARQLADLGLVTAMGQLDAATHHPYPPNRSHRW